MTEYEMAPSQPGIIIIEVENMKPGEALRTTVEKASTHRAVHNLEPEAQHQSSDTPEHPVSGAVRT
jgi:hypothetical protein